MRKPDTRKEVNKMKIFEIQTPDNDMTVGKDCLCLCGLASGSGSGGKAVINDVGTR